MAETVSDEQLAGLLEMAVESDLPKMASVYRELQSHRANRRPPDPAVAEVERLREALRKAAEQFEFYEREHYKKMRAAQFNGLGSSASASREKALTNAQFATMCRAALEEPHG